jgi:LysM repeat protein
MESLRTHRTAAVRLALTVVMLASAACLPEDAVRPPSALGSPAASAATAEPAATPLPTRLPIVPGQIMPYAAQSGDTLEAVASHFNTTVDGIRVANASLPREVTTLPPGQVIRVPTYFAPFTGTPFRILPDSDVVNGPPVEGWDLAQEVDRAVGTGLFRGYTLGGFREGWQVVDKVAQRYSVNPRILLALLEYRTGGVTRSTLTGR